MRTIKLVLALVLTLLVAFGVVGTAAMAIPTDVSTFTVNSTADTGDASPDGTCDSCTLREAIQEADFNNNPAESDRIKFNISGPGVHTISPNSDLPIILEPVIINGYSQRGSSANTLAQGTNAKLRIQIAPANPPGFGLVIEASNSVVKGLVINSFSHSDAIRIRSEADPVTNVRIEGNFIGTNPAGTRALANGRGVDLFATSNSTVGGTSLASRNLISGNELAGVFIQGGGCCGKGSSDNNRVQGNLIGTQRDGIQPLGNGSNGVSVLFDAVGNRILSNSIFSNGGQGIDLLANGGLGPTANDLGDTDTGPNNLQNFPELTSAKTISGTTTIEGTLNSRPNEIYRVEFFSNPSGDEGQKFIGSKNVSTDGLGDAEITFSPTTAVAVGQQITATATRISTGDTSEFSAAQEVTAS
jgi:CSLREA domain-containing protein